MNKGKFGGIATLVVLTLLAAACEGGRESVEAPAPGLTRTATAVPSPTGATQTAASAGTTSTPGEAAFATPSPAATAQTPAPAPATPTPGEATLATPQAAEGMVIVQVAQDDQRPLPAARVTLTFKDSGTGKRLAEPVTQLTDAHGQAVFDGQQILSSQLGRLPSLAYVLADVTVEAEALRAEEEGDVDLQGGAVLWFNQCQGKLLLEWSTGTHFNDPTEERIEQVREIFEALPRPLPSGENWEIQYETSGPFAGQFHIAVDAGGSKETVVSAVTEALDAVRSLGHEPCALPLLALLVVSFEGNHPMSVVPPSPGSAVWEPCKETCSE